MNTKNLFRRVLCCLLLLAMLAGYFPTGVLEVKATEDTSSLSEEKTETRDPTTEGSVIPTYPDLADRYILNKANPYNSVDGISTTRMGAMTYVNNHVYFVRTSEDLTKYVIARYHHKNNKIGLVTASGINSVGEAKAMSGAVTNHHVYLFLSSGSNGADGLLCFEGAGENYPLASKFAVKTEAGVALTVDGIETLSISGNNVTLLIRNGLSFYTATITVPGTTGTLTAKFAFSLDQADAQATALKLADATVARSITYAGIARDDLDRLYVSAQVDCASVILVYPDVTELMANATQNAKAEPDLSIIVANGGQESFRLQDIACHQGLLYFSSRYRWLSSEDYRGDIGHLLDSPRLVYTRQEAFRESGVFIIGGTGKQTDQTCNPGDGTVTIVQNAPLPSVNNIPDRKYQFGLEPDTRGYWYIRSVVTDSTGRVAKKYLTVDPATGAVSLQPKEEGNPNQLWYIKYNNKDVTNADMNETLRLYEIISKSLSKHLNNQKPNTLLIKVGDESKTFTLMRIKDTKTLEDLLFDAEFYKLAYPEKTADMTDAQAKTYYKNTGIAAGHLPSPYFDPDYYIANNSDVVEDGDYDGYAGAYDHFIRHGFWEGRQGSIYFSARDYLTMEGNEDVVTAYYPYKLDLLYHFKEYGSDSGINLWTRTGSAKFSLKEMAEEFCLLSTDSAASSEGHSIFINYVAGIVRLKNATGTALEDMLFDAEYYSTTYPSALSEDNLASFAGNNYAAKLRNHWKNFGQKEGRTASLYFDPSYYTARYPDKVKYLENAYDHYITQGHEKGYIGSAYVAMSVEAERSCSHTHTATARFTSCTGTGNLIKFCARCRQVINRIDAPALAHRDSDSNGKCDLCKKNLTDAYLKQSALLQLPLPGLDNELVADTTIFAKSATEKPEGTFYMVQKSSDGIYRIFDPTGQSVQGTIAATQVYENNGRILGADPEMGVYIVYSEDNANSVNHYHIITEGEYYLYYAKNPVRITRKEYSEGDYYNIDFVVSANGKDLSLQRKIDEIKYFMCLEQRQGMEFFEWSNSYHRREADDVLYLYRVLDNRLHTDGLYNALQRAVSFIPENSLYDGGTHSSFLSKVEEVKDLYLEYNGTDLSGNALTNKNALQEELDHKERELLDLIAILEINLEGNTVSYFPASMYNWNEDAMNALVSNMDDAAEKGFYFESANNKGSSTAPFSNYDDKTTEIVKEQSTKAQMYSIYSGLVAEDLSQSTNPPFHNDNVVAADYWSEEPIKNTKDVYTEVKVPFVYKDGYYVLDSDQYGVFFEDEPASGATMTILEEPLSYYWSNGRQYGNAWPGYRSDNLYGSRPTNGYITAFQPFARASETLGKAYETSASVYQYEEPVNSYIIDGVAYVSGTNPTVTPTGRGTATWGFGMRLDIKFNMTENGCIYDTNGNETPITFKFSGDDDVWVFINDKLVMDIGGSHDAIQGEINFATGDVIITSDTYDRIRDKNVNGYGRNNDPKNPSNEVGSILSNKMYQKNIYTEVFNMTTEEFAKADERTLTIYYMDRGKGATNCAISFNLPQSDTLTVEKEIPEYYGNGDGTLTDIKIPANTMAFLNEIDFGFTLTNNNIGVGYRDFEIVDRNGEVIGTGTTDAMGHFTLKNGQTARFRLLQFNGQTYQVTEDRTTGRFAQPIWECYANGKIPETSSDVSAYIAPAASVQGEQYGSEIISYRCTNAYTYYFDPVLEADDQYVVMDYGKPIEISVIDNAVFDLIPEKVAQTATISYIIQPLLADDKVNPEYILLEGLTDASDYGKVTMLGNRSLRYTLSKMLDTKVQIQCKVSLTLDDMSEHTAKINIIILPATTMYYETAFLKDTAKSLTLTSYKPENDSYNWTTKIADQGYDTLQDNGVVGDEVFLPVIDSEQIPSNAFFTDFDGRGYDDRYGENPLYCGYDYDTADPWTTTSNAMNMPEGVPYDNRIEPEVDLQKGTLNIQVGDSFYIDQEINYGYGPHLRTFDSNINSYETIHMVPSQQTFVQIRFKLIDCKEVDGEQLKVIFVYNKRQDNKGSYVTAAATEIVSGYDYEGSPYITLRMPIVSDGTNKAADNWYSADYISGLGLRFKNIINSVEGKAGSIEIDYIYVGPEIGWYDSIDRESLYFGFDNSKSDQLRYSTSLYGNKNFDEEEISYWASKHNGNTIAVNNSDGTLTVGVPADPQSGSSAGPFLMTTGKPGTFPGGGNGVEADSAILNFDPKNADYIQIRFKAENCTWAPADNTKQLIFLYNYIGEDGTEAYATDITANFTLPHNGEYQTVRVAIPDNSAMRSAKTITAFGVRFRGTMGDQNRDGSFTIDELFLGSEEALNRLDDPVDHLFFDFTDSDEARIRYAASPYYGEYNFDDPVNRYWGIAYGADTTNDKTSESTGNSFAISDGIVEIAVPYAPMENQIRLGTTNIPSVSTNNSKPGGYYPWHGSDYRMPLSFPAEIAEFAQVRYKIEDCTTISGDNIFASIILYHPIGDGKTDFKIYHSAHVPITNGYITANIPINLPDTIDTILGFGIAFRNIQSQAQGDTGMISVDYIYVGKRVDAVPSAESLYITFDDTQEDRERYNTDTYRHVNPDYEDKAQWAFNNDKVESIDIENRTGTATLTTVPKGQRTLYDEEGNFIWPDVYMENGLNGNFHKGYLDYKPQNAEIFQIRFKMQNLVRAKNASGVKIWPYVKLFWLPSEFSNSQDIVLACDGVSIDETYLNNDTWITLTGKIPEELRNHSSISSIHPYFGGIESKSETELGKVIIDYIYIGPDDRPDQVYGYDSHYNNDTTLSDGSSLFVEGSGVKVPSVTEVPYPNSYTEATFSFKGTGFDLISRTGPSQATIRVEVTDSTGTAVKKLTVNNKGQLELYQIPVVSVQGLDYGEYNVTLWVNKAVNSQYEVLNRGGEFYFDALRIYDPLGNDEDASYRADREAYNFIKEIRNILLDKETFENLSDATEETIEGAVFVDVNSHLVQPDGSLPDDPEAGVSDQFTTVDVATYNGIGPKNEVYLAPGQAVAFNLKVSTNRNITSLDIGAKTIVSGNANLKIGILAKDAKGDFTIATDRSYTISSATAQYLEMDLTNVQVKSNSDSKYQPMYLVFYNITASGTASTAESPNANGVISLTDVKVAYNENPSTSQNVPGDTITDPEINPDLKPDGKNAREAPIQMLVDGDTLPATKYFVNAVNETPILEENATIRHTLNLASDISLNYLVATSELAGYDSFYMQCEIPVYNGNEYVGTKVVKLSPVLKGNFYYFTLEGLTAVHMMDVIEAKLVMTADGRSYYSETDSYSIAKYAYAQLAKEGNTTQLKQLCADLLRYGAKAQIHKGYRTDCLADCEMTADQKAYLTDSDSVTFGNTNRVLEDLKMPSILWVGKALNLESKVSLKFVFSMGTYEGKTDDLSLRVSYKDTTGAEKTLTLSGAQEYNKALGYYAFTVDSLLAAELRSVVSVQIYHGEAPLSCTMEYSADTYGAGKTGTLLDLCKALFAYSDSAKAFFG